MKAFYFVFPAILFVAVACSSKPVTSDGRVNEKIIQMSRTEQLTYTGQPVAFSNVKVQRVVSEKEIWVGPNGAEMISVVVDSPDPRYARKFDVRQGDIVTITGTLKNSPVNPGQAYVTAENMTRRRAE